MKSNNLVVLLFYTFWNKVSFVEFLFQDMYETIYNVINFKFVFILFFVKKPVHHEAILIFYKMSAVYGICKSWVIF
jgi:hypothetical protein